MQSPPLPLHWMAIIWTIWFWGVGGGRGANIVHALGPVFSILKWVVTQLVLRGIVSCWHPVESDYTGYIGESLSTDRWPTGARLTNRPTVNWPLIDWCSTYQPLTDRPPTVSRLVPDLPTLNPPLADGCPTYQPLTVRPPTVSRLVPDLPTVNIQLADWCPIY